MNTFTFKNLFEHESLTIRQVDNNFYLVGKSCNKLLPNSLSKTITKLKESLKLTETEDALFADINAKVSRDITRLNKDHLIYGVETSQRNKVEIDFTFTVDIESVEILFYDESGNELTQPIDITEDIKPFGVSNKIWTIGDDSFALFYNKIGEILEEKIPEI